MDQGAPIAVRGAKFDVVLDAARGVFMEHGFEGASIGMIVEAAKVSRATLYNYFPDKRAMFTEVVLRELERAEQIAPNEIRPDLSMEEALTNAGHKLIEDRLSDFGFKSYRLCMAEAVRFSSLAEQYYQRQNSLINEPIVGYMKYYHESGKLLCDAGAIPAVAEMFVQNTTARIHQKALFLGQSYISAEMVAAAVKGAVTMHMDLYSAKSGKSRPITASLKTAMEGAL